MKRLLSLLLVAPGLALAQSPQRPGSVPPGVGTLDTRREVILSEAPWNSMVRVQTDNGGVCSGVLVAPNRVLTAAHCVISARTGQPLQARRVHVLWGYDRGTFRAHAVAAAIETGPWVQGGPRGADWAVLRLSSRLPAPSLPIATANAAAGTTVMLGGWQADRPHVLVADTGCRVEATQRDSVGPLLVHGCAATNGSSGAPLLVRQGRGWAVAGVQVAGLRDGRGGVAVPARVLPLD